MTEGLIPGFYGKVPSLGDFVLRRLPRPFLDTWDKWLQSAMTMSREQLGENWLDVYLTSPIWRFGLSAGLCGDQAWAGVLMPSVDKVGRYYPLTIAAPLQDSQSLQLLFGNDGNAWFETLEQLALSCLDDGAGIDWFDEQLQAHPTPFYKPTVIVSQQAAGAEAPQGKFACHLGMKTLEQANAALLDLNAGLMNHFMPQHSLWSTSGSDRIGPSLLVCDGLPPIDAFAALLAGDWANRGWSLTSSGVRDLSNSVPLPSVQGNTNQAAEQESVLAGRPYEVDKTRPVIRPSLPLSPWRWRSFGMSVVGRRRSLNEDNLLERSDAGLWVVADGMGGHMAGDVASQAIVDALATLHPLPDLSPFADRVDHALQEVNAKLCRLAEQDAGEGQIIGSTVVVLLAVANRCELLWAGDSRLYRFREGKLEQLSRDHSLLDDLNAQGLLTPEQKADPGRCDIITRAVGAAEVLHLERESFEALSGDKFLLCSDGIDKELNPEEIEGIFRTTPSERIIPTLIAQADERGARDNVTALMVEVRFLGES